MVAGLRRAGALGRPSIAAALVAAALYTGSVTLPAMAPVSMPQVPATAPLAVRRVQAPVAVHVVDAYERDSRLNSYRAFDPHPRSTSGRSRLMNSR